MPYLMGKWIVLEYYKCLFVAYLNKLKIVNI